MDKVIQETQARVQELFNEANSKKLSTGEFAGKIWLGVLERNLPELSIALTMFEKALVIPQPEIDELVQHLIKLTLCGDSEAITRALSLICDGLIANNETEKNEISSR